MCHSVTSSNWNVFCLPVYPSIGRNIGFNWYCCWVIATELARSLTVIVAKYGPYWNFQVGLCPLYCTRKGLILNWNFKLPFTLLDLTPWTRFYMKLILHLLIGRVKKWEIFYLFTNQHTWSLWGLNSQLKIRRITLLREPVPEENKTKETLMKQGFIVFMYHVSRELWKWLVALVIFASYMRKLSQSDEWIYVIFTWKNHLISSLRLTSFY